MENGLDMDVVGIREDHIIKDNTKMVKNMEKIV